ncbi:MAG: amidohydrolase family protein, partial [Sphaerochaetaceae bacterium]
PSFIEGSLETIAKGMEEIGIRGLTCYEVTDRNGGMDEVRLGINENVAFAKSVDKKRSSGENVLVEAMIGAHAPFTLPNKALELMSEATETTQRSIHLHVAEDKYDTVHSHHLYHQDIMERLDRFNLLNEKTLLVHGLWLNEKEIELMNERKSFLAHNPRSNMNNNVGYFKNLTKVKNLVLGTDGCGGNMFEEIKLAFFKHKDQGGAWWPTDFVKVLNRGNRLLELYFKAKFGSVAAGCKADLIVLDSNSPTPLVNDNGASQIVWGISSNAVESVMVDGKMVMENRTFGFDVKEIYAKAREAAKRVWQKVDTISPH